MPTRGRAADCALTARSDSPKGEWTMPARQQEQHEQHGQAVRVGRAAVEVEREEAEDRPDRHALQAIGAARQPRLAVGEL